MFQIKSFCIKNVLHITGLLACSWKGEKKGACILVNGAAALISSKGLKYQLYGI